jgi:hypothetical protein
MSTKNDNGGVGSTELWSALFISITLWLPIRSRLNVLIRGLFRQYWPQTLKRLESTKYEGIFEDKFDNKSDEIIDWSETIVHHTVGGLFMIIGIYFKSTRIFVYGAMSEAGCIIYNLL